jgi:hypothetical protein
VVYRDEYLILCNPAPIFQGHFTVSHVEHRPQAIEGSIATFLALARDLSPRYQVFYNGPRCGASAPDHLHFQASPVGSIPIADRSFLDAQKGPAARVNGITVTLMEGIDRSVLVFRAGSEAEAVMVLERILRSAKRVVGNSQEPMINILVTVDRKAWQVIVFLRSKHRPEAYFFKDERKLMISPAAVDMGGLVITPIEEDFHKISPPLIAEIYREVSLEQNAAVSILEGLA